MFAQPSKQQRPLLGQSVSLCPGDQQVDTAPANIIIIIIIIIKITKFLGQSVSLCPGDQQVDKAPVLIIIIINVVIFNITKIYIIIIIKMYLCPGTNL